MTNESSLQETDKDIWRHLYTVFYIQFFIYSRNLYIQLCTTRVAPRGGLGWTCPPHLCPPHFPQVGIYSYAKTIQETLGIPSDHRRRKQGGTGGTCLPKILQ